MPSVSIDYIWFAFFYPFKILISPCHSVLSRCVYRRRRHNLTLIHPHHNHYNLPMILCHHHNSSPIHHHHHRHHCHHCHQKNGPDTTTSITIFSQHNTTPSFAHDEPQSLPPQFAHDTPPHLPNMHSNAIEFALHINLQHSLYLSRDGEHLIKLRHKKQAGENEIMFGVSTVNKWEYEDKDSTYKICIAIMI